MPWRWLPYCNSKQTPQELGWRVSGATVNLELRALAWDGYMPLSEYVKLTGGSTDERAHNVPDCLVRLECDPGQGQEPREHRIAGNKTQPARPIQRGADFLHAPPTQEGSNVLRFPCTQGLASD